MTSSIGNIERNYLIKQRNSNNINKNVLNKIIRLEDDINQGLLCGHGLTLKDEVCLIPDNLALFFPVEKGEILYSIDTGFNFLKEKNKRKNIVKKKSENGTGKILLGGTIISDILINFNSFYGDNGYGVGDMKNIISYSHTGIITGDLHILGKNYEKNIERLTNTKKK